MTDDPGSPLTHSRVLRVAIPVVLSNATVPLLGLVDTGVMGQLGAAAPVAAVGIGAITLGTVYWIFGFLRMGTAGLAAQAIGAGDRQEVAALLTRVLLIGAVAGCVLFALQSLIFRGAFALAPASPEVEALAYDYMRIRMWSAPAAIAAYGIGGWLVAHARTMALFWLQLWTNGINMILSVLFVLGFGWGIEGVAIATVMAELAGLGLGLWMTRSGFRGAFWRQWHHVFDTARLGRMASVNTDILIRSVILLAAMTSFLYIGADFGDTTLAANQILLQFLYITSYAMDGLAFAAEAFVGQAMGAHDRARVRRTAMITFGWGAALGVLLALIFWVLGPALIETMTHGYQLSFRPLEFVAAGPVSAESQLIQTEAARYLPWMIVVPLVGFASWILDGIFIGATRTRDMRNMMVVSGAGYALCVLVFANTYENHGLWASLVILFGLRGLTLVLRYPALERSAASGS